MLQEGIVLSARNISKQFTKGSQALFQQKDKEQGLWALKHISFDLKQGQILGIIGRNGAGKSTLLKILSEVIPPTEGEVEYAGSILSILDIGTGFHPDLSGYENIFLNASLLGMKKKKVAEKVDEIIDFSGIREAIHQPVKTYSNGMYLRLALSIALFTDNEILLLDEVIAVGDVEFRHKAMQRIRLQAGSRKACIMISHDLGSVLELCDECILMDKGEVLVQGKSKEVVEEYYHKFYSNLNAQTTVLSHAVCEVHSIRMEKENIEMAEPAVIRVKFAVKEANDFRFFIRVRSYHAFVLSASNAFSPESLQFSNLAPGEYELQCEIPANLFYAGHYLVDFMMGSETEIFVEKAMACDFKVLLPEWEKDKNWNTSQEVYPFRPLCRWKTTTL